MSCTIKIGTASWTDRSLIESGGFYPPDCTSPEARLRYYASQFPLVEVDSSYYGIPAERNAQLWVERTPADFIFNVKAFRLLTTHQTPPKVLPVEVREGLPTELAGKRNVYYNDLPQPAVDLTWQVFESSLRPLHKAGKLAVVVLVPALVHAP